MPPAKARKPRRRPRAAAASPESSSAPPPVAAETPPASATPERSPAPPPVAAETTPAAAPPDTSPAPPPVAAETPPASATAERSPAPPPVAAETTPAAAPPDTSPAPPPVVSATPPESAEASVTVAEDGGGNDKMAVEDLGEVGREEATGAESLEEEAYEEEPDEEVLEEEDPDAEDDPEEAEEDLEDAEEDAEDAEEESDEVEHDEKDTVLAAGSEKTATVDGGDEEKSMVTVSKEGGGEVTGLESAVVEEAANVDDGLEEAEEEEAEEDAMEEAEEEEVEEDAMEEAEEEEVEEDAMEEDTTELPGEGAAPDDMNELSEEEHEESGHEGTNGNNDEDGVACQLNVHSEVQNGELDSSLLTLGSVSVGNAKDLQIFLHGLPKGCPEKDITEVFSQFGEIESIKRIRKKNGGVAFVRYMSTEAAKKALAEFKEGAEVTGEMVKVSASRGDNTLYLRNICKSWTKEQVRISLRSIGIDGFDMSLPVDPEIGGQNRGIAFLKFASPDNAKAASQLLQQPDPLITIVRSVKESAQIPTESSQELAMQMQVKTVYLEHIPLSWDKSKVKECCKAYGVIQDVHILKKSKAKISFVEFSSRKSALACVEGINSANIGGELKLAASLARPRREIQLDKKSAKGGVKVNSDATSKDTNNSIKKKNQNREVVVKDSPHKLRKGDVSKLTSHVDVKVPQSSNPSKGKRKAGKTENTAVNERLPKRARKNRDVLTKPSNRTSHGGYARVPYAGESSGNIKRPGRSRYVTGNQSYPIAGASSRSKPNARDLEPHAGYIPPTNRVRAPANHVPVTYVSAPSTIHHIDDLPHAREIAVPPPAYGYTSNPQYQDGYPYAYLPPPRPSGSYHYPGTGAYSPRRRYY
ncbi:nucleolin-like isoform X2 [Hordeum vulgare subsp. vulgare]|uniref:nucleolin-like isoform X2 n=1 Tax=Hordeum vulgare subsp. vulgare TaxID=112509 RepID=UPI001D1A3B01|nr:nucleolin-like isoform X2 [Hordeum vulgare subsp. vulgare]